MGFTNLLKLRLPPPSIVYCCIHVLEFVANIRPREMNTKFFYLKPALKGDLKVECITFCNLAHGNS